MDGRDINKDAAKPPLMERTGWSGLPKHLGMPDHPVCGDKVGYAVLFFHAAATPPVPGGELPPPDSLSVTRSNAGAYSVNTRIGSRRVARRAGTAHADRATAAIPIMAALMIHGFVDRIP